MSVQREYGSMALFASAEDLLRAAGHLRAMGFTSLEAYAPHVVEGLDEVLQLPQSRMPTAMFGAGLCGGVGMLALQYYSAVIDYPVHIAGRPLASWPAFLPAALEIALLCAAVAGVAALFAGSRLPKLYHPVFNIVAFERISQDAYALVLRSDDPGYAPDVLATRLAEFAPTSIVEVPR